MKFILNAGSENIIYKPVEDTDKFKQYAAEILGGDGNMSASDIKSSIKEIYIDEKLVGYIGFSEYTDDDVKMLGIGKDTWNNPLISSNTQGSMTENGDGSDGRPESDGPLSDEGENTRDQGKNDK